MNESPNTETLAAAREVADRFNFDWNANTAQWSDLHSYIAAALDQHARKLAGQMVRDSGAVEALRERLEDHMTDRELREWMIRAEAALSRLRELTEGKG